MVLGPPLALGGRLMRPAIKSKRPVHGQSLGARVTKYAAILITVGFVGFFLLVPLVSVFYEAFHSDRPKPPPDDPMMQMMAAAADETAKPPPPVLSQVWAALSSPNSLHAIKLTLIVAAFALPRPGRLRSSISVVRRS
jgi:ABC-type sulfate transport system permease subunit